MVEYFLDLKVSTGVSFLLDPSKILGDLGLFGGFMNCLFFLAAFLRSRIELNVESFFNLDRSAFVWVCASLTRLRLLSREIFGVDER